MDEPTALVTRLAGLARLDLSPEEVREAAPLFARILGAFEALARAELPQAAGASGGRTGPPPLREDVPAASLERDALLANAPEPLEGFYGVPQTIPGPDTRGRSDA